MSTDNFNINKTIIVKCLEGDIKSQFILYKRYSAAMFNIAVRITGNKMDAEDILQESFIIAFERLDEMDNPGSFGSWLKRIVINNSISLIRKRKMVFEDLHDEIAESEDHFGEIDMSIDPSVVHKAIKELPDGSRTILVLHALEGYRYTEIAELLGITESTCRTQYRRGLELLNKNLKNKIYVD